MAKLCNNCSVDPKQFTDKSVIFSNTAYEAHEYLHIAREKRLALLAIIFAMLFMFSNIIWVGVVAKQSTKNKSHGSQADTQTIFFSNDMGTMQQGITVYSPDTADKHAKKKK